MQKTSLGDRLRYAFDNFMSQGTLAMIGGLAVASLVLILTAAAIITVTGLRQPGSETLSFEEAAWESLMRTLDAGTMGGDTGWGFRFIMFGVTLGGVFVISTLIGVLTNGMDAKLQELRKGRSRAIESEHTAILGWSEQIFSIVTELITANANRRRAAIVILADKDKVEMEDEIRDKIGRTRRTRVVCRTGNPLDHNDLTIASLNTSRSIIVLSPPAGEKPDAEVIKTLLAITNHPQRRPTPYHIVAEMRNPQNMEAARLAGRGEAELVLVSKLIARIIAQTCRQSGLSVVYNELLDFSGDEIYSKEEPSLAGRTFGEALLAYEDSAVIGLRPADGTPRLNPPMNTLIRPGDKLIVISADDDSIYLSGKTDWQINTSAIQLRPSPTATPERTLILGWNWRAPAIITELDNYVAPGSTVRLVADYAPAEAILARECAGSRNQNIVFQAGDTTDRRLLDQLAIETYAHVIVLAYAETLSPQQADAHTLITLLHLRDIAERAGHTFSIVSEMLDIRNRTLADVTQVDDFIVSDKLVSLMLSQISENKELSAIFADIFAPEGSEIYLKPVANYVRLGEPVNFYTVVAAARQQDEIAIGYCLRAHATDAAQNYGVVVNPDKSRSLTFAEGDRLVVLAES